MLQHIEQPAAGKRITLSVFDVRDAGGNICYLWKQRRENVLLAFREGKKNQTNIVTVHKATDVETEAVQFGAGVV